MGYCICLPFSGQWRNVFLPSNFDLYTNVDQRLVKHPVSMLISVLDFIGRLVKFS